MMCLFYDCYFHFYVVIKADIETTIIAFIEKWKNCIKNICQKKSFS